MQRFTCPPLLAVFLLLAYHSFSGVALSSHPTHATRSAQRHARLEAKPSSEDHESSPSSSSNRRRFFSSVSKSLVVASSVVLSSGQESQALDFGGIFLAGSSNSGSSSSRSGVSKKVGGLANKIRGITVHMDELQRDLMQERWDLVQNYPAQFRSYVPVFTTYTDAAFPSELPSDYGLRVALRYEVGRYFASLERFKRAVSRNSLDEAYVAYSDMSLHLDRYLRVGGLYTFYDSTIDNEPLYRDYNDALVYADPVKDPAEVRDLVVLCKGPDKGKTGIVIGIYPDATNNYAVKLDRFRGMREIRVVPQTWAAKRLGEQDPDDVFLIPRKASKS